MRAVTLFRFYGNFLFLPRLKANNSCIHTIYDLSRTYLKLNGLLSDTGIESSSGIKFSGIMEFNYISKLDAHIISSLSVVTFIVFMRISQLGLSKHFRHKMVK